MGRWPSTDARHLGQVEFRVRGVFASYLRIDLDVRELLSLGELWQMRLHWANGVGVTRSMLSVRLPGRVRVTSWGCRVLRAA